MLSARFLIAILSLVAVENAWSSSLYQGFTYQGRFLSPNGGEPMGDVVDLTLGIYSPDGSCLLYEERHTNIDLSQTSGLFSVHVGSAVGDPKRVAGRDPGKALSLIFSNSGEIRSAGANCASGYTPSPGDPRKLRVTVYPQGGAAETMSPDLTIAPVPQASVAETLQGLDPTKFVQISGAVSSYSLSKSAFDSIFGIGGVQDASSLHQHDSLYAQLGLDGSLSLGSEKYFGLGVHAGNPDTTGWGTDASKIGRTWFDSGTGEIKYWDGSAIKSLGISGAGVSSFNTRTGAVTLLSGDVTGALGFTPQNAASVGTDTKASLSETTNNPVKYSSVAGSFYLQNASTAGDTLRWDGSQWQVGADSRHWSSNGTDVFRTGGNVGIGTTNPLQKLSVSGDGTNAVEFFNGRTYIHDGVSVTPNSNSTSVLDVFSTGGSTNGIIRWGPTYVNSGSISGKLGYSGSGGTVNIGANNADIAFLFGASEMVRFTSSGNVGIGTTNPAYKLQVSPIGGTAAQTAFFQDQTAATGITKVVIKNGASQGSPQTNPFEIQNLAGTAIFRVDPWGLVQTGNGFYNTGTLNTTSNGAAVVGAMITGAPTQSADLLQVKNSGGSMLLNVAASGNVGIATTNPAFPVHVANGSVGGQVAAARPGAVDSFTAVDHSHGLNYSGTFSSVGQGNDTVGGFHAALAGSGTNNHWYALIGMRMNNSAWNNSGPSPVAQGNYLPGIGFAGQTNASAGTGMKIGASVLGLVDGAVSSAVLPTAIVLQTSQTDSSGLTERMRIGSNGRVGIGTTAPRAGLDVNATILGKPATSNGGTTIDFGTGNLQYTSSDCTAFTLHNLKDGGTYVFAVKGAVSATCSFNAFSDAGSTALTVHLPPDHGATTAGKHTVYNFIVMGTDVYAAWAPNY